MVPPSIVYNVSTLVDAQWERLRALRRDLHRYPEAGWMEFRTSAIIASHLGQEGYQVLVGDKCLRTEHVLGVPLEQRIHEYRKTLEPKKWQAEWPGVVGIAAKGSGPTVAFRFDMDATEVQESRDPSHRPVREGFASAYQGLMHACGHDGHVAIGLGLASLLAATQDLWQGRVKFIFQPAEEGGRGAIPMVEAGIVDDVDYFIAFHIGSDILRLGEIALEATGFLSSVKLDAEFQGVASHAAGAPERGRNALLAATLATVGIHGLPRYGQNSTFVNVGVLQAGTGRNVIPAHAELQLEVRGDSDQVCHELEDAARRVLEGAAAMQGVSVTVRVTGKTVGGKSDPDLVNKLREAAKVVPDGLKDLDSCPLGGGEDATFFMRQVQERGGQALYFLLGATAVSPHHSSIFDFDERALLHGVKVLTFLGLELLRAGGTKA